MTKKRSSEILRNRGNFFGKMSYESVKCCPALFRNHFLWNGGKAQGDGRPWRQINVPIAIKARRGNDIEKQLSFVCSKQPYHRHSTSPEQGRHCWTWWRIGRVVIFRPEGRGFESRYSRHVGTLGKSLTRSCLWCFGVKLRHNIGAVSGALLNSSGFEGAIEMAWRNGRPRRRSTRRESTRCGEGQ